MNFHLFWTIAKYEASTLQRSWFFRIFAALAILSLGIFNFAVFFPASGSPWIYKALGAAVPYANMILLNLAQAIVAIFLASEFLKQDQKNDSVEVIYVRPMSNTTYVLGKTMGILIVFLALNFIVLSVGVGFSFIRSDTSTNVFALLVYPLLISLPTLVFIIGLSFSLMVIIKNQAVTFILLLGYIALTIFYLNEKAFHVFDYIAYKVPMMHSSFSGFGDLPEILLHRGIYLFLGIGFVFFTIYKLGRLPQSDTYAFLPLLVTFLFLLAGASLAGAYLNLKSSREILRSQVTEKNNLYPEKNGFTLNSCAIDLRHHGSKIEVLARLQLENKGNNALDTLILRLNPSLHIQKIIRQGTGIAYTRDLHLIKIPASPAMQAGEKWDLEISYQGAINEAIGFADLEQAEYEDNYTVEMFAIRKRPGYLTPNYVGLTSAVNWYPTAGAGYTTQKPYGQEVDFTRFKLNVKTSPELMAISQGQAENSAEGEFTFSPEYPLPQLCLFIGPYSKKSVTVDSIEYSIYTKRGNDYYTKHFQHLKDTIPQLIKNLVSEYELKNGIQYPYRRFSLIEVPLHFATDRHRWSYTSDAVQPEMLLYHEKGINLESSDFEKFLVKENKQLKKQGKEVLPKELQSRLFSMFIKKNFLEQENKNSFPNNLFPQFFTFSTHLNSPKWPLLNMALEIYLQDGKSGYTQDSYSSVNLKLKESSLAELLSRPVKNQKEAELNYAIIQAKSRFLFQSLKTRFGEVEFNKILEELISRHRFKSIAFTDLENEIQKQFNSSIAQEVDQWYHTKTLPAYLVEDVRLFKIAKSEKNQYQLVFNIANVKNIDGLINPSLFIRKEVNWDGGLVYLPALSARKIGIVLDEKPASLIIKTGISENMPGEISIDLRESEAVLIDLPHSPVEEIPFFSSLQNSGEIVVDNEDAGFIASHLSDKGYLKQWIDQGKEPDKSYKRYRSYSPPNAWTPILDSRFYGDFIHSAVYLASGSGDKTAEWQAKIEVPADYDVYFYSAFFDAGKWRNQKTDYNITIQHDGGRDEIRRFDNEFEPGWNYLGTYHISSDSARVLLSDKSDGAMVIADAVKWVRRR